MEIASDVICFHFIVVIEIHRSKSKNIGKDIVFIMKIHLPKIGLRNIKTAISTTLCIILYLFVDRNPTFACIGAVFGMDNNIRASWKTGGNRLIGTVIGGFLGMGFFFIQLQFPYKWMSILLLFFGIIVLIYISQLLQVPGAIQAGSVVFYIVMLNTPVDQYVGYALNRMVDTGIGVIVSVCINMLITRPRLARIFPGVNLEKEFPTALDESK